MPQALNRFRTPKAPAPRLYQLLRTAGVFLLGLVLGLLAKWLDTIPHDGSLKSLLLAHTGQLLSRLGVWAFLALLIAVLSAGPECGMWTCGSFPNCFFFLPQAQYCTGNRSNSYTLCWEGFCSRRFCPLFFPTCSEDCSGG